MRFEVEAYGRHRLHAFVSHEVHADSKVCMQGASRFIGFTAIRILRNLFPSSQPATVLAVLPSLAKASLRESSFRSATPPRSSFTSNNAARRSFDASCAYPGFRPSSRHHQPASTNRESFPSFASFRPQALSASRRFTPQVWLAGLFHPAAVSRTHPVQGLILFAQPYYLVDSLSMPPCR